MVYVPRLKSRHRRLDMPALRAEQQSISDQYSVRVAALELAVSQLPKASAAEVVAEAQHGYDAMSAFLVGGGLVTIEDHLRKIREACKDGMKPSPCVACRKITPLYLRTSAGPVAYCQECFTAEIEAENRRMLREAKAAGFETVDAWLDWWEQHPLPKSDWE